MTQLIVITYMFVDVYRPPHLYDVPVYYYNEWKYSIYRCLLSSSWKNHKTINAWAQN